MRLITLVVALVLAISTQASAQQPAFVRVDVTASQPHLTLHRITGMSAAYGPGGSARGFMFERVCTAPCSARLALGDHQFAVSAGIGTPIPVQYANRLTSRTHLELEHHDLFNDRFASIAAATTMTLVATVAMLVGVGRYVEGRPSEGWFAVSGLSLGLAIVLPIVFWSSDSAEVRASPRWTT